MPTTPTGPLSAKSVLRTTLAACATFQTLVGEPAPAGDPPVDPTDEEIAAYVLAHIHIDTLPDPADGREHTLAELASRSPYAIVFLAEQGGFRSRKIATGTWADSFSLRISLAKLLVGGVASEEDRVTFDNVISGILSDLREAAETAGYFDAMDVAIEDGPWVGHPTGIPAQGLWLGCVLSVSSDPGGD